MLFPLSVAAVLLAAMLFTLRILTLLRRPAVQSRKIGTSTRLLVILGSGGHTAEMLAALRNLDPTKYTHRSYVVSSGDSFSALKAKEFEHGLKDSVRATSKDTSAYGSYDIAVVPRARKIHQSLLSTPLSSLQCLAACFGVLQGPDVRTSNQLGQSHRPCAYPDLIVSNGPGTAVIVILAAWILRFTGLPGTREAMRTIYVESWARVRNLSLSGKILVKIVDRFLVQWEALIPATGGRGEYLGVLV